MVHLGRPSLCTNTLDSMAHGNGFVSDFDTTVHHPDLLIETSLESRVACWGVTPSFTEVHMFNCQVPQLWLNDWNSWCWNTKAKSPRPLVNFNGYNNIKNIAVHQPQTFGFGDDFPQPQTIISGDITTCSTLKSWILFGTSSVLVKRVSSFVIC